jgi:hypothetical protein
MDAITFRVSGSPGVEWTLLRLLALIANFVDGLKWRFDSIEFSPSPGSERAELLFQGECNGLELIVAVALDPQLIEGSITGSAADGNDEIRIVAVDGQHWDIYARSEDVISTLRTAISDAIDLPGSQ